jgi:SAM-dependent methyltransferase
VTRTFGTAFEELICLECGSELNDISNETIVCNNCNRYYPIISGIPVLIDEAKSIFTFEDFKNQRNLFFDISPEGSFKQKISRMIPSGGADKRSKQNFKLLEDLLLDCNNTAKVLVLGGSIAGVGMESFLANPKLRFVESDVSFGPRTQVILDAHQVPYADGAFDCVIAQAVLEHVLDPVKCVKEIFRVLRPGGVIYTEIPFMQQVHGGAYDFTRYSMSGHRRLLRNFKEVKSGALVGVGTAFLWSYEHLMLALFGRSNALRLGIKAFSRVTGFWLKYIDRLTSGNKRSIDGASATFFIGTKSDRALTDKDIISYYK